MSQPKICRKKSFFSSDNFSDGTNFIPCADSFFPLRTLEGRKFFAKSSDAFWRGHGVRGNPPEKCTTIIITVAVV